MSKGSSRILLSANQAWNLYNFRRPLIEALLAAGNEVVVAAPPGDGYDARLVALGCTFHPVAIDAKGLSPLRDIGLTLRYRALMRDVRPDAYLAWTIKPNVYGALAARLCGVPAFPNVSGLGTAFIRRNLLTRIVSALYRAGFARAQRVFFQNESDAGLFVDHGLVRAGQVWLLPGSGVDLDWFAPHSGERRRGRFLMIARLIADKGVREFVAAARQLKAEDPRRSFAIAGPVDVANRTAIPRDEVAQWRTEGVVEILGPLDDVRPQIADADCVVLPSYREGTSRVLLEGAAMARPLVATDVPGCREVIDDGVNGFLCAPADAASLAIAMRHVAELDDEAWAAMGAASRVKAEGQFASVKVVDNYVAAMVSAGVPLGMVTREVPVPDAAT